MLTPYLTAEKWSTFSAVLSLCALLTLIGASGSDAKFVFQGENNLTHNTRISKIQCVEMPYQRSKLNYCRMEVSPNQTTFIHASLEVPGVLNFLLLKAQLFYKYTTYRPFLVDWSVELCQAVRYPKRQNMVASMVVKVLAETLPEFFYKCPHGNRTYETRWGFPSKFVFTTIPSGDYRLDVHFSDKDEVVLFAMQMFASVRKQGIVG